MLDSETQRWISLEGLDNGTEKWIRFTFEGLSSVLSLHEVSANYVLWIKSASRLVCFCIAHEMKMVYAFFNVWKNKQQKNFLWHMKMAWNSNRNANKTLLGPNHARLLTYCLWLLLQSWDHMIHKAYKIYCLALEEEVCLLLLWRKMDMQTNNYCVVIDMWCSRNTYQGLQEHTGMNSVHNCIWVGDENLRGDLLEEKWGFSWNGSC